MRTESIQRCPESACVICAGHRHLGRLRPSLAYKASEPGNATVSGFRRSCSSGTALRPGPLRAASSPASGGSRPGSLQGSTPRPPRRLPTLFCPPCRCRSGDLRQGWLICPALAGAPFWDLLSRVFLRGDGGLAWGKGRGSDSRPLLPEPLVAQIVPRGFSGPLVSQ